VFSQDDAGNLASDNNSGGYYGFTTTNNAQASPSSADTPIGIPDSEPAGATSTINVTQNLLVTDVDVRVSISHPFDGDIKLILIPPTGPAITLSDRRGGPGDNYASTVFDDEAAGPIAGGTPPFAGSFRPESPLSTADGIVAAGAWKLK